MIKRITISLFMLCCMPYMAWGAATSTSYNIENDGLGSGGGRQTADSYTNIGMAGESFVSARATSTSYLADFGAIFWNPAALGALTVTESSADTSSAEFTLAYSSADPDSPLFMACYGTSQADVEDSCGGTATRAFTGDFSYEFTGLSNNTAYYFKVYALSGYDSSGNPIISHRYSETATATRSVSTASVFNPVSGASGSGSSMSTGAASAVAVDDVEVAPAAPLTPPSIVGRVTDLITSLLGGAPSATAPAPLRASSASAPSVGVSALDGGAPQPSVVGATPAETAQIIPVKKPALTGTAVTFLGSVPVPLAGASVALYSCPSPSARPSGCALYRSIGQANPIVSDSDGSFRFVPPAGIYRLAATKAGYESAEGDGFAFVAPRAVRLDMKPVSVWRRLFKFW